jgi:hypothetical protein
MKERRKVETEKSAWNEQAQQLRHRVRELLSAIHVAVAARLSHGHRLAHVSTFAVLGRGSRNRENPLRVQLDGFLRGGGYRDAPNPGAAMPLLDLSSLEVASVLPV